MQPMDWLVSLVEAREDWLIRRILSYAKAHNYVQSLSAQGEQFCRWSVADLADLLSEASQVYDEPPELEADEDLTQDPVAGFGVLEADRQWSSEATLSLFLGLLKYYRQSYTDLLGAARLSDEARERFGHFLTRFFDRIELGFCAAWEEHTREAADSDLRGENFRLHSMLQLHSLRDPQTGLFDRAYMEATLERELSRAVRQGTPLAVIMFDLDRFADFNKAHGHETGDELIRQVGQLMQSTVRQDDVACRYGGEEFVIVMPHAATDVAVERAEALRRGVAELAVVQGNTRAGGVTLSLGVAAYPEHGTQGMVLIARAAEALAAAKHAGRDRVMTAANPKEPASA